MLEDPDNAPYPAPVQLLWQELLLLIGPGICDREIYQELLVDALESVQGGSEVG
jgi:hypothetical protein